VRIVVWNVSQALHRKWPALLSLDPDIAIVPECANPAVRPELAEVIGDVSCRWTGLNPVKGLGVFAFGAMSTNLSVSHQEDFEQFLPVTISGGEISRVLGVWAFNHRSKGRFKGQTDVTVQALKYYAPFLSQSEGIVAGDFNENAVWDKPRRPGGFTDIGELLDGLGLASAYHYFHQEDFGSESQSTYYYRKAIHMPYQIDYCFLPKDWLPRIRAVEVRPTQWLKWSDHVPLVVDLDFAEGIAT